MAVMCLNRTQAQLVVVDVQEKMLAHIHAREDVLAQIVRMMRAAHELELPLTISEQYVRGLGPTVPQVLSAAGEPARFTKLEKMAFSLMRDEPLREHIVGLRRPQVVLVGIESHVCVQQTAFDLLRLGLEPCVLADAVGSRRTSDRDVALDRMRAAGIAVSTVEAAIFEMLELSGTDLFKRLLPIVR
ncbi:MAG: isochorismatase family protein [Phycisphaerae bacterium]|nr:isochorismatase family protein [Phycisphaerae bacterium]